VLGRHHARVAHHLPGFFEATETAELGCEGDRRHFGDSAQGLQRIDDGSQLLGCGSDGLVDSRIEAFDALALVVNLEDQLEQRRILLGMWKPQSAHPLPSHRGP
jgi:hypothetical protein